MIINGTFTYVIRDTYHKACPTPGGMTHVHNVYCTCTSTNANLLLCLLF